MITRILIFLIIVIGILAGRQGGVLRAQYQNEDEESRAYNVTHVIKTVEGLNFNVEEDRPIVKVAGIYRPIDIDEYVALKFGKLQRSIDDRLAAIEKRLTAIETSLADLRSKNQTGVASAPPSSVPSK